MSTSFQSSSPIVIDSELPAQTANTYGNVLVSNGTSAAWNTILSLIGTSGGQTPPATVLNAILPTQTGQSGKVLTTDGATVTWQSPAVTVPYDVTNFINGTLLSNETVMRVVAARSFAIPANFAGSIAVATTAPAASSVFAVRKNGVQIASITYSAGSTSGVFSSTPQITFNVGDQLSVTAPSTPDETLASIAITIAGVRTA